MSTCILYARISKSQRRAISSFTSKRVPVGLPSSRNASPLPSLLPIHGCSGRVPGRWMKPPYPKILPNLLPRFYLPNGKAHTARYIRVRQLTGMRTSRYRAVLLKSTVGGRLRKKKGRGKEERRRGEEEAIRRGKVPCPRALAAHGSPASCHSPRVTFLPAWGDETSPARGERSRR
ncbi:hypothetical protein B296_00053675, partial [Ensete ventricosum]